MNSCIIEMPSVTYAQKARAYFRENGFRCDVIRNTNSCGYSINVAADRITAEKMLDSKRIPYKNTGKGVSSW